MLRFRLGYVDGTKPILIVSIFFSAALAVNGAINPATKVAIIEDGKKLQAFFILRDPSNKIIDSTQR